MSLSSYHTSMFCMKSFLKLYLRHPRFREGECLISNINVVCSTWWFSVPTSMYNLEFLQKHAWGQKLIDITVTDIFVQLLTNTVNAAINNWSETLKLSITVYIHLHSQCDFIMTSALILQEECLALQATSRKLFSKFSLIPKYQYRVYSSNIWPPNQ